MTPAPWDLALARQVLATETLAALTQHANAQPVDWRVAQEWGQELQRIRAATPYSFSGYAHEAIQRAAQTIPADAVLAAADSSPRAMWWHFDPPLPIQTASFWREITALNITWYKAPPDPDRALLDKFPLMRVGLDDLIFHVCTYALEHGCPHPSTSFWIYTGHSLATNLLEVERVYDLAYPDGPPSGGSKARTLQVADQITRYLFAALTWINQTVLAETDQHIERHVGKRAAQVLQRPERIRSVKVIALRRVEHTPGENPVASGSREWQHQWVVSGHWRNQPYGPERSAHRLVFIHPYVKGPADKPLLPAAKKVYAVLR